MFARIEPVLGQRWYSRARTATSTSRPPAPMAALVNAQGRLDGRHPQLRLPLRDLQVRCPATGCTHLIAGSNRVWETSRRHPRAELVRQQPQPDQEHAGRPLLHQPVASRVSLSTTAIVGTNDGNVQYGFGLGTGVPNTATWVNVTGGNAVLPNRPILDVATDPLNPLSATRRSAASTRTRPPRRPRLPGDLHGQLRLVHLGQQDRQPAQHPVDSNHRQPALPQQVFVGQRLGRLLHQRHHVGGPVWFRFNAGMPNVMIWDLAIDRGFTTLAAFTRSRGALRVAAARRALRRHPAAHGHGHAAHLYSHHNTHQHPQPDDHRAAHPHLHSHTHDNPARLRRDHASQRRL